MLPSVHEVLTSWGQAWHEKTAASGGLAILPGETVLPSLIHGNHIFSVNTHVCAEAKADIFWSCCDMHCRRGGLCPLALARLNCHVQTVWELLTVP